MIGTKNDLEQSKVSKDEIHRYISKKNLLNYFFTSVYDNHEKKRKIFKSIVESIDPNYPLNDFSLFTDRDFDSEDFKEFLETFSICPICKKENHYESLKSIYISNRPDIVILREQLEHAMKASRDFNLYRKKKLNIGIPCCNCYRSLFNKDNN